MLTFIQSFDADDSFPPLERAETDPNGLLAVGGDLSPTRLITAYEQGIFPWFNEDQPILWWSPDPRMVLFPEEFHASRSLKKNIKRYQYRFSVNQAFNAVIEACAEPRAYAKDTWINSQMLTAYKQLHKNGYAHSIEVWHGNDLVGGLYGIAMDRVFFGESMFSTMTDASKVAFWLLSLFSQQLDIKLIDCQVYSEHLKLLGAREIPRKHFQEFLSRYCNSRELIHWPVKDGWVLPLINASSGQ